MEEDFMPQIPYFPDESRVVRVAKYYDPPHFSMKEVARFFERTNVWLRWRLSQKELMVRQDGSRIQVEREGSGEARVFTLEDIRDISQALYHHGKLSKAHYNLVARRVSAFHLEKGEK